MHSDKLMGFEQGYPEQIVAPVIDDTNRAQANRDFLADFLLFPIDKDDTPTCEISHGQQPIFAQSQTPQIAPQSAPRPTACPSFDQPMTPNPLRCLH